VRPARQQFSDYFNAQSEPNVVPLTRDDNTALPLDSMKLPKHTAALFPVVFALFLGGCSGGTAVAETAPTVVSEPTPAPITETEIEAKATDQGYIISAPSSPKGESAQDWWDSLSPSERDEILATSTKGTIISEGPSFEFSLCKTYGEVSNLDNDKLTEIFTTAFQNLTNPDNAWEAARKVQDPPDMDTWLAALEDQSSVVAKYKTDMETLAAMISQMPKSEARGGQLILIACANEPNGISFLSEASQGAFEALTRNWVEESDSWAKR
jgi:hypothetical protein